MTFLLAQNESETCFIVTTLPFDFNATLNVFRNKHKQWHLQAEFDSTITWCTIYTKCVFARTSTNENTSLKIRTPSSQLCCRKLKISWITTDDKVADMIPHFFFKTKILQKFPYFDQPKDMHSRHLKLLPTTKRWTIPITFLLKQSTAFRCCWLMQHEKHFFLFLLATINLVRHFKSLFTF